MNLLKKNKTVVILILLGIGLWSAYQYVFAAPLTTNEITAEFQGKAEDFKHLIQTDFTQWHNKIIQITGTITAIQEEGILLNQDIYCQFDDKLINAAENEVITLKGRVIGFDELLEEIKLNQCIIIQK
jgi:hypothetical protein